MKTLVLGDIHGRTCWKDIIEKENPDKVIFLGDYVSTHENMTEDDQIHNLEDILTYKEENPDSVILLRGNHDNQHLGYYWAECSGLFMNVLAYLTTNENRERFLNDTQWVYIDEENKIVFSHAGISSVWLADMDMTLDKINEMVPSESFGFIPDSIFDNSGESVTQPPVWIRPRYLARCTVKGYTQVVGHTPVYHIVDCYKDVKYKQHIWLCDCLPNEYLVIENNEFIIKKHE